MRICDEQERCEFQKIMPEAEKSRSSNARVLFKDMEVNTKTTLKS